MYIAEITYEEQIYMQEGSQRATDIRAVEADSAREAREKIKEHPDYTSIRYEKRVSILDIKITSPIT